MVDALRRELVGPAPAGEPLDLDGGVTFPSKAVSYAPRVDAKTGEEILGWTRPVKRYGIGVLFPDEVRDADWSIPLAEDDTEPAPRPGEVLTEEAEKEIRAISGRMQADTDSETLDLGGANARRPSTMGLTVLLDPCPPGSRLVLEATGGRYEARAVMIVAEAPADREHSAGPSSESVDTEDPGIPPSATSEHEGSEEEKDHSRTVFRRRPWSLRAEVAVNELSSEGRRRLTVPISQSEGLDGLGVSVEIVSRASDMEDRRLVTAVLVNRSRRGDGRLDEVVLFQVSFRVRVEDPGGRVAEAIGPYPGPPFTALDEEERSLALLYRDSVIYGVGHNCAADWDETPAHGRTTEVRAEPFPRVETPSTTPEIHRDNGEELTVPMVALAGLDPDDDGRGSLEELLDAYERWIRQRREELADVPAVMRPTGEAHLERCEAMLDRMRAGLELVLSDRQVRRAFELANRAVLLQQLRSDLRPRLVDHITAGGDITFSDDAPIIDERRPAEGRGHWRPFQIAFLLAALPSTSNGNHPERDDVELIFFPTGGGKTEAYLGLTAFSIVLRRLRDVTDAGVDVLMRYTLRLLTAQQFIRAARLVCALERLRHDFVRELGPHPIEIGIWLGSATTPNTRRSAVADLRELIRDPAHADDPFLLNQCPWCGAQMGPVRAGKTRPTNVVGYAENRDTVRLNCPDSACAFHDELPVVLVDEDVYERRPSIVLGTVDKFAMLAWREEARSIFGIGDDGSRRWSPPNLIIQDELHLISGPLGSMVGLYELAIEELASDTRGGQHVLPKLVTSTATIRGYDHQVQALYGRGRVNLFPPHGLSADDSFFARYARTADGELQPGCLYLGVHAGNHTSLIETQVSVTAALLQGARDLPEELRDPWWTQLAFFNTLRELGTSLSLAQSNVPMQLRSIANREGLERAEERRISHVIELTSRLRNDEVPRAIGELEKRAGEERPVDVCLASNIIEVGIDIARLSLMVVVGQPKTTSQYIQVTGRVGRRWWERPGLVVTILNPNRSRDRSHYERFRSYHERLYAQVEPTSVTPFSASAVDRALHGALAAFLRQRLDRGAVMGPRDVPEALLDDFEAIVVQRVGRVDKLERRRVQERLDRLRDELRVFGHDRWARSFDGKQEGLLVPMGDDVSKMPELFVWPTPMSMRSVDAECELSVTRAYSVDHLAAKGRSDV